MVWQLGRSACAFVIFVFFYLFLFFLVMFIWGFKRVGQAVTEEGKLEQVTHKSFNNILLSFFV